MKEGLDPNQGFTGFMKEGLEPNKHRIYEGRTRSRIYEGRTSQDL